MKKKNEATLYYKDERFLVWEDDKSTWHFTYLNLDSVNTGHKELQSALNIIYESIDDKLRKYPKKQKWDHKREAVDPRKTYNFDSMKKVNLADL